jgi:hypothetical protein
MIGTPMIGTPMIGTPSIGTPGTRGGDGARRSWCVHDGATAVGEVSPVPPRRRR